MIRATRHAAILRELRLRGSLATSSFATRLGVSAMTIRRDLEELEAAGELVRTHGGARTREPGHSATLGIIVPRSMGYYATLVEGASQAAASHGVRLVLATTDHRADEEVRTFLRMQDIGVDGIIITPARESFDPGVVGVIASASVPVVVMDRELVDDLQHSLIGCVLSDAGYGAALAVEHLAGLGHRRIALVSHSNPKSAAQRAGFDRAVADHGVQGIHPEVASFAEVRANPQPLVADLVASGVTGVIVSPDELAVGVVQAALASGVAVPEELSVVAYNDEVAALAEVPLTAVAPPKHAIGRMAVEACLGVLAHDDPTSPFPALRTTLRPMLRLRESCGPARRDP